MSVGANIKKRRFEMKMSQQELAEALGYRTRSTIAKIESGENDISQKKLERFARVLDTTAEALITGYTPTPFTAVEAPVGNRKHKNVAIMLAGGKSGRNRQNIPSQFIHVQGKPILVYCMEAYQVHPLVDDIYVVCLKGWESIVKDYAEQFGITKLRGLISGGSSGIQSLKNAVEHIRALCDERDMVIIQESTRPLITPETISRLLSEAAEKDSATICHSMKDYVQFNVASRPRYADRNHLIALQSPEAHRLSLLTQVFDRAASRRHPLDETCCTMLLYNLGYDINFVESPINNIKIAREEDIAALEAMLR